MNDRWMPIGKALVAGKERMAKQLDPRSPLIVLVAALRTGTIRARGRKTRFAILGHGFVNDEGEMIPADRFEWGPEASEVVPVPNDFWSDFVLLEAPFSLAVHGFDCAFDLRFGRFGIGDVAYVEVEILSLIGTRAGRKAAFDWDRFSLHALDILAEEGGLHPDYRQARLENAMSDWCEANWEKVPSEASIRRRVKSAERAYSQLKRTKAHNQF